MASILAQSQWVKTYNSVLVTSVNIDMVVYLTSCDKMVKVLNGYVAFFSIIILREYQYFDPYCAGACFLGSVIIKSVLHQVMAWYRPHSNDSAYQCFIQRIHRASGHYTIENVVVAWSHSSHYECVYLILHRTVAVTSNESYRWVSFLPGPI